MKSPKSKFILVEVQTTRSNANLKLYVKEMLKTDDVDVISVKIDAVNKAKAEKAGG